MSPPRKPNVFRRKLDKQKVGLESLSEGVRENVCTTKLGSGPESGTILHPATVTGILTQFNTCSLRRHPRPRSTVGPLSVTKTFGGHQSLTLTLHGKDNNCLFLRPLPTSGFPIYRPRSLHRHCIRLTGHPRTSSSILTVT